MSPAEKEKIERTPHEIVITKSCRAKVNDDTKNADFAVGDKVTMTGKYARELISLGKAVIAGSPEHKKWVEDEAKKAESKKKLAPHQMSTAEAIALLAEAIEKNTAAVTAALTSSKKEK